MKKYSIALVFLFVSVVVFGQHVAIDTIANSENKPVFVKNLSNDSLSSSFYIEIFDQVAKHKHLSHSESIYIIEGEGVMILGQKEMIVKAGDFVFVPKNTPHAVRVLSKVPLKVLSVQAPYFDGKDRVFVKD